jgi:hypothetical protein
MATEQRAHEVVRSEGSVQLRRYPAYLTAKVTVDAGGYDEAANAGFNALAGYIFGNNVAAGSIPMTAPVTATRSAGEKIAMTVPVTSERARNDELQSATPLCTVSCAGEYVVRFTMPSEYASIEDLPAPNDPRVVLEEVPEHLAVALAFSGRLDDEATAAAVEQLEEWTEQEGLVVIGEPEAAQYDAPWKPGFVRHNEVIIPVRSA